MRFCWSPAERTQVIFYACAGGGQHVSEERYCGGRDEDGCRKKPSPKSRSLSDRLCCANDSLLGVVFHQKINFFTRSCHRFPGFVPGFDQLRRTHQSHRISVVILRARARRVVPALFSRDRSRRFPIRLVLLDGFRLHPMERRISPEMIAATASWAIYGR